MKLYDFIENDLINEGFFGNLFTNNKGKYLIQFEGIDQNEVIKYFKNYQNNYKGKFTLFFKSKNDCVNSLGLIKNLNFKKIILWNDSIDENLKNNLILYLIINKRFKLDYSKLLQKDFIDYAIKNIKTLDDNVIKYLNRHIKDISFSFDDFDINNMIEIINDIDCFLNKCKSEILLNADENLAYKIIIRNLYNNIKIELIKNNIKIDKDIQEILNIIYNKYSNKILNYKDLIDSLSSKNIKFDENKSIQENIETSILNTYDLNLYIANIIYVLIEYKLIEFISPTLLKKIFNKFPSLFYYKSFNFNNNGIFKNIKYNTIDFNYNELHEIYKSVYLCLEQDNYMSFVEMIEEKNLTTNLDYILENFLNESTFLLKNESVIKSFDKNDVNKYKYIILNLKKIEANQKNDIDRCFSFLKQAALEFMCQFIYNIAIQTSRNLTSIISLYIGGEIGNNEIKRKKNSNIWFYNKDYNHAISSAGFDIFIMVGLDKYNSKQNSKENIENFKEGFELNSNSRTYESKNIGDINQYKNVVLYKFRYNKNFGDDGNKKSEMPNRPRSPIVTNPSNLIGV